MFPFCSMGCLVQIKSRAQILQDLKSSTLKICALLVPRHSHGYPSRSGHYYFSQCIVFCKQKSVCRHFVACTISFKTCYLYHKIVIILFSFTDGLFLPVLAFYYFVLSTTCFIVAFPLHVDDNEEVCLLVKMVMGDINMQFNKVNIISWQQGCFLASMS